MTDRNANAADRNLTHRALCVALTVVALTAIAVHTFSILASRLWVYPDSIDYVTLAGGIADKGDFANELFLIRPPGYPLLLGALFVMFQGASPFALLALQHLLAAATSLLTVGIAWTLTRRAAFACLAGLLSACSLQSIAYANLILTETTYSFLLAAILLALVRYVLHGRVHMLAVGSGLTGLACLVKPVGVYLLGACTLAAVIRFVRDKSPQTRNELDTRSVRGTSTAGPNSQTADKTATDARVSSVTQSDATLSPGGFLIKLMGRSILPRLVVAGLASFAPALCLVAPWKIASATLHTSDDTNRCLDYVLYLRAFEFDGLDSGKSESLREIKQTVADAVSAGSLPDHADFRDRATVIRAYESTRGLPFAVSTAVMGRAARDAMLEHAATIGLNTIKYAAWMLLAPDPVYRFQPGGAPGIDGKRDADATIYDVGTYAFGPGSWEPTLTRYRHYLPLDARPRSASTAWTDLTFAWYKRIGAASPIIGIADSPYSEWIVFCLVGLALTMFTPQRGVWILLLSVLSAHVLISAFLGGPQTRYALPVQPILKLGGAWFLVEIVRCARLSLRTFAAPAVTPQDQTALHPPR